MTVSEFPYRGPGCDMHDRAGGAGTGFCLWVGVGGEPSKTWDGLVQADRRPAVRCARAES